MSRTDVVLVHPAYSYPEKGPPLGLAYLKAYLEANGLSCSLLDVDALRLSRSDAVSLVRSKEPRVVGISFMTNQAAEAHAIADACKRVMPDVFVVAGGCHVSALPYEAVHGAFDASVVAEGEATFLELATAVIEDGKLREGILGVVSKDAPDEPVCRRSLIPDLDSLPFPSWSDMPPGAYGDVIVGSETVAPVYSLLTSRGCPNECVFCASKCVFERRFRKRSAANIFAELVELRERYGARLLDFVDDTLTIDGSRVLKLCELIRSAGLRFEWMCNARVNTVDKEMLQSMASAGCKNICFGVESGDPVVLERIKKRITLDQVREAHTLAREAGMAVSSFFMVANLGETLPSIEKTIQLANEISDFPSVAIATPYPGTELFEIARANGWLRTTDWSRYVTAPHVLPDYRPVSTNGILTDEQIMDAYYYVNRSFMRRKLSSKYGRHFYFNGAFYSHEVGARVRAGGVKAVARVGARLLSARPPSRVEDESRLEDNAA